MKYMYDIYEIYILKKLIYIIGLHNCTNTILDGQCIVLRHGSFSGIYPLTCEQLLLQSVYICIHTCIYSLNSLPLKSQRISWLLLGVSHRFGYELLLDIGIYCINLLLLICLWCRLEIMQV